MMHKNKLIFIGDCSERKKSKCESLNETVKLPLTTVSSTQVPVPSLQQSPDTTTQTPQVKNILKLTLMIY